MNQKSFDSEEVFPNETDLGNRIWGRELLLYVASGAFTFKRLEITAGARGGLQYHRKKDEVAYLVSGKLLVRYDLQDGEGLQERICLPGDVIHFPTGLVHQEEAIEDCVLIEASTPFVNDRVRVESKYGITDTTGLPSTELDEVREL